MHMCTRVCVCVSKADCDVNCDCCLPAPDSGILQLRFDSLIRWFRRRRMQMIFPRDIHLLQHFTCKNALSPFVTLPLKIIIVLKIQRKTN